MMQELLKGLAREASGNKDEPSPWPVALALAILAVIVGGVMIFTSIMARRRYAAEAHKADVLENEARQKAELFDKLEASDKELGTIQEEIRVIEVKKKKVDDSLSNLDSKRAGFQDTLNSITSWDDVL